MGGRRFLIWLPLDNEVGHSGQHCSVVESDEVGIILDLKEERVKLLVREGLVGGNFIWPVHTVQNGRLVSHICFGVERQLARDTLRLFEHDAIARGARAEAWIVEVLITPYDALRCDVEEARTPVVCGQYKRTVFRLPLRVWRIQIKDPPKQTDSELLELYVASFSPQQHGLGLLLKDWHVAALVNLKHGLFNGVFYGPFRTVCGGRSVVDGVCHWKQHILEIYSQVVFEKIC